MLSCFELLTLNIHCIVVIMNMTVFEILSGEIIVICDKLISSHIPRYQVKLRQTGYPTELCISNFMYVHL